MRARVHPQALRSIGPSRSPIVTVHPRMSRLPVALFLSPRPTGEPLAPLRTSRWGVSDFFGPTSREATGGFPPVLDRRRRWTSRGPAKARTHGLAGPTRRLTGHPSGEAAIGQLRPPGWTSCSRPAGSHRRARNSANSHPLGVLCWCPLRPIGLPPEQVSWHGPVTVRRDRWIALGRRPTWANACRGSTPAPPELQPALHNRCALSTIVRGSALRGDAGDVGKLQHGVADGRDRARPTGDVAGSHAIAVAVGCARRAHGGQRCLRRRGARGAPHPGDLDGPTPLHPVAVGQLGRRQVDCPDTTRRCMESRREAAPVRSAVLPSTKPNG